MIDGPRLSDGPGLRQALATAAAWAMIASAGEFIVHLVGWYGFGRPMYQGIDAVWSKPLVNLLLFLPPVIVLRHLPARHFVACLAFPAVAAVLLLIRPGSPIPMIILSAGIGTQLGVFLGPARRQAFTVRVGKVLAVGFLLAAIVTQGARFRSQRGEPATAGPPGAPNVLLIILDTVRAASLSLYGGRAATPTLDALAATGIVFDRAVSTAPWTLPSHASMFTGLWPHEHRADWRAPLDHRATTLAEVLQRHGYRTGGFVANLVYTSREHGLNRGFQVYRDYRRSPGALFRSATLGGWLTTSTVVRRLTGLREVAGRKRASHVNREFLAWEQRAGNQPWFAFLNYFDAHEPYIPRPPFAARYSSGLPPRSFALQRFWSVEGGIAGWDRLEPAEVEAERAAYEEAITGLDHDVGALLADLRRRGILDRTIVVVTSDHGELFGEHDAHAHGNNIFWRTLHVPLVVSWPGHLPAGTRVADPVSLRNISATILGLALPDQERALPGTTLLVRADSTRPPLALSELSLDEFMRGYAPMRNGALQSLSGLHWQYTRAAGGQEEVYWTGNGTNDTLVTVPGIRAAVIDSARALLSASRIPAPPRGNP